MENHGICLKAEVIRGFNGAVTELRIINSTGFHGICEVMRKALMGEERGSQCIIVDGIMVFCHNGRNMPVVIDCSMHEIQKKMIIGQICVMPFDDGVYEGISITT